MGGKEQEFVKEAFDGNWIGADLSSDSLYTQRFPSKELRMLSNPCRTKLPEFVFSRSGHHTKTPILVLLI